MNLRRVPASTGLLWLRQGLQTFARQPLALSGLFLIFMALITLLSLVPVLGMLAATLLTPAFTLALMAATREALAGRFPRSALLLTALRGGPLKTRGMLVLGMLYGLGLVLILLLSSLLDGGGGASAMPTDQEAMRTLLNRPSLWFALVSMLALQVLFWHAPALLFWHGVAPVKSLFFSALACWANKGALAVFLLGWTAVFLGVGALVSLLGGMLGASAALGAVVYFAMLLLAAMFFTSIWFVFRDSFETGE